MVKNTANQVAVFSRAYDAERKAEEDLYDTERKCEIKDRQRVCNRVKRLDRREPCREIGSINAQISAEEKPRDKRSNSAERKQMQKRLHRLWHVVEPKDRGGYREKDKAVADIGQ